MVPGTAKTPGDRGTDSTRDCPPATGSSAAGCRAESTTAARKGAANSPPAATIVRPTAKRTICRTFDMVSTAEKERGVAERRKATREQEAAAGNGMAAAENQADPATAIQLCATFRHHRLPSGIFRGPAARRLTGTVDRTGTPTIGKARDDFFAGGLADCGKGPRLPEAEAGARETPQGFQVLPASKPPLEGAFASRYAGWVAGRLLVAGTAPSRP